MKQFPLLAFLAVLTIASSKLIQSFGHLLFRRDNYEVVLQTRTHLETRDKAGSIIGLVCLCILFLVVLSGVILAIAFLIAIIFDLRWFDPILIRLGMKRAEGGNTEIVMGNAIRSALQTVPSQEHRTRNYQWNIETR
ncbi:unnamed protein product [Cyprideis torosa]|uniref:Uncharacterized protein n=1 Tax=Cyprideis torosa TaxID=163714 RepID=A0A7R8WNJ4_9CRUS|nr:unnamed protein product [Cyprideis torosa]CAG0899654.1 unnamed protein product [Cyprideis torosa]